jgi:hypothetical protein
MDLGSAGPGSGTDSLMAEDSPNSMANSNHSSSPAFSTPFGRSRSTSLSSPMNLGRRGSINVRLKRWLFV